MGGVLDGPADCVDRLVRGGAGEYDVLADDAVRRIGRRWEIAVSNDDIITVPRRSEDMQQVGRQQRI